MSQPAFDPGTILDSTGTPIPIQDVAPPSFGPNVLPSGVEQEVNDRYRLYPSKGLTPGRISRILEQADIGEPYEWIELCEEMIEKDLKIASVSGTRRKAVVGINHEVRPANLDEDRTDEQPLADEIAKFCDAALNRAGIKKLIAHLMDAVGKGIAVDWIDGWAKDENGKRVPQSFSRIPTKHLRWGITTDVVRVYSPSNPTIGAGGDIGSAFEPYTTVRALEEERADTGTRGGLLRTCVWPYLFKNTSIKDWMRTADGFGIPQRVLGLTAADYTNKALYEKARAALKSMGSSASGVINKDWELTLSQAATKGSVDLFKTLIDDFNTAIAQLWLGHELSSEGSKGGGQLGISAANQVRQDYLEADCNWLSEIIKRDLLVPMVGWNWGWDKMHLVPDSVFDHEPAKDLVAEANVTSTIARTFPTLKFSKQQLRDKYGFDAPATEDGSDGIPEDDAITAGAAGQTEKPFGTPAVPTGTPDDIGANAVRPLLSSRSGSKRSGTSRQKKVDRVTAKAVAAATVESQKWLAQLRTLIREANRDGVTMPELAVRIAKSYPDFEVSRIETLLHDQNLLVRLFGRNG